MKIEIASPVGGASHEEVTLVSLHTSQGQIGILPGHADLLALVEAGPVRIEAGGRTITGVSGPGVLRIEAGGVYLSVDRWASEQPDRETLAARMDELEAILADKEAHPAAVNRARRELGFLEAWLASAERLQN